MVYLASPVSRYAARVMPITLYLKLAKWGAVLGLLLAVTGGLFLWGHHIGAAGVQAKWDVAKILQATQIAEAQLQAKATEDNNRNAFNALAAKWEAATHAPQPSIADHTSDAVAAGALQLRSESAQTCPAAGVPIAAARSRELAAATAAAATQRLADSVAAVRVGDAADKREADFRQQIETLRALLAVERQTKTAP